MTPIIFAWLFAVLLIGILLGDHERYINRGMSKKFYLWFASLYSAFIVCCIVSRFAAVGLLALMSLVAPFLCLKRFEGRVWQINKLSYILAGVSFISLVITSYNFINYYIQYPDYDFNSFFMFVFLFSTPTFYLVTCSLQLEYMKMTDEEMKESKATENHGSIFYIMPLLFALLIISGFFYTEFKEQVCKGKFYKESSIIFCSEITDVSVRTVYGHKGRSYLEYKVTTDYILPETKQFFTFTNRENRGFVDREYNYMDDPWKFEYSPFLPGKKIVIERSYFDKRIFTLRNEHPSGEVLSAFKRPVVEVDSVRYFLDNYADKDFLKENTEFYYHYCGINRVVKAVKLHGVEENHLDVYQICSPYLEYIYYNPVISHSTKITMLDTLLFFKNLNKKISSNWICMDVASQTSENWSKITDYGYYFNGKIWSKEEFESEFSELQEYFQ
ncbi:MAG: hypothetical protein IKO99_05265 [Bacteroidales bacterium]|nr:hypothetical protein [Bacteroidales bacterium]